MTPSLLAPTLLLAVLIVDVVTDLARWEDGKINHSRGLILRSIPLIGCLFIDWHSVLLWPLYGSLFNLSLNIGRKLKWDYIGQTSAIDKLMRRYKWLQPMSWTIGLAALAIYIII